MQYSNRYTVGFALAVCLVCSVFVTASAVGLADRQAANARLDLQKKVLSVAGLLASDETVAPAEIAKRFTQNLKPRIIELRSGAYADNIDAASFDQDAAAQNPATSTAAPSNQAKVARLPKHIKIFQKFDGKTLQQVILPIHTKGLWSTLYGYVAVDADGQTVKGLTFYKHAETPGLGGEVDNPRWKALWPGRKIYDASGAVALNVIKGQAGSPSEDPHHVDGLSGATLTSRGVGAGIDFWMGEYGYRPYLGRLQKGGR